MILGVPRENRAGEDRVALVPDSIPKLVGVEILVEKGAGEAAGFSDSEYADKGARIVDSVLADADILVKVRAPTPDEIRKLRKGQVLVALLDPFDGLKGLTERGVSAFALERIPRITRAQSMDVLSSMSNLAGYKAVLLAATHLPRFFPMLMTAAGTIPPAKVFVIGAGVAGLQAIATARRLGAVVEAYDTRPVVKEQVESLGARFFEMNFDAGDAQGAGGYAKEQSKEFYEKQQKAMGERLKKMDVVITTALVPGRPAPMLIPAEVVEGMRPGSVIVDLAVPTGGNCELTEKDKIVTRHGVTLVGLVNIPSTMPCHASRLFSRNVTAFLGSILKDGKLHLDLEDEIVAATLATHEGKQKMETR
jgi:NAD(P) transhydrogenase subunit alpha